MRNELRLENWMNPVENRTNPAGLKIIVRWVIFNLGDDEYMLLPGGTGTFFNMDFFIGQIMLFAGNYAPEGFVRCDGRELKITGNEALFAILGTLYGGNAQTTFNLPDLRARFPRGAGISYSGAGQVNFGQMGGHNGVALEMSHLPRHTHVASAGGSTTAELKFTGTTAAKTKVNVEILASDTIGTASTADGNYLANAKGATPPAIYVNAYGTTAGSGTLKGASVDIPALTVTGQADSAALKNLKIDVNPAGGGAAFDNNPPYLGLGYFICIQGLYPVRAENQ